MKILLQVPAGLKTKALEIASQLERDGHQVFISGENVYGACDLREDDAQKLGIDKIINYGHTQFMESNIPVEYKEIRENIDILPILEKHWQTLQEEKICLLASLQFIDNVSQAKSFLEEHGKLIIIPPEQQGSQKLYPGQVLGCACSLPEADAYLYIGSGNFHATSPSLIGKAVYSLDVEHSEIRKVDSSLLEKQKYAAIALAKHAKTFGILVSTRRGQFNLPLAEKTRDSLKAKGKHAFIIVMDEFTPDKLVGIKCDCWVNTACPRIAIDNRTSFGQPIVNANELS
jgi:2-(3-amino-3-carboxypropyl)histidine synthase